MSLRAAAVLAAVGAVLVALFYAQLAQGPGGCDDTPGASCAANEPSLFPLLVGAALLTTAIFIVLRDWARQRSLQRRP